MPKRNKNFNIPNLLSVLRIILIIPFMINYLNHNIPVAVVILVCSGLTDAFDGYIARRFNQFTELGQMLDPVSDKLTQASVVICLSIHHPILLPFLLVFVCKECIMLIAGGVLLKNKKKPCAARWYGKLATVLFYITFVAILAMDLFGFYQPVPVFVLLIVTCSFMIFALVMYAREFFRIIKSDDPDDQFDLDEVMDKERKTKK